MGHWVKKNKGIKKKKLTDTDNSMVITRGKGEVEEGKGRISNDGRRLDLGWRSIQYTNDIYKIVFLKPI